MMPKILPIPKPVVVTPEMVEEHIFRRWGSLLKRLAGIAHKGERLSHEQQVAGSIPASGTNIGTK